MKEWQLVADGSCDWSEEMVDFGEIGFSVIPFRVTVGEQEFCDDSSGCPAELLRATKAYKGSAHSACPSPEAFAEAFRKGRNVIAITISGALSGSYNSALLAQKLVLEEDPSRQIHVIDSKIAGGSMNLQLWAIAADIRAGLPFDEIASRAEKRREEGRILFSLAAFDNLVKNGRMSRMAGLLAGALGIRAIATNSPEGKIEVLEKPRGEKKAIERLVALMGQYRTLTPTHRVVINQCQNPKGAEALAAAITAAYGITDITILECRCLNAFYADEHGLLLSF